MKRNRHHLLLSLFLIWLAVFLLLMLHDRQGYYWSLWEPSSTYSLPAAIPTLVSRKVLADLSNNFNYVQQQHHHHHHHHHRGRRRHHHRHGGHSGRMQHSSHNHLLATTDQSKLPSAAERIVDVGPPDPLYHYPDASMPTMVDPRYGYSDEKRLVPTGPNPLHH